ncbi:hypothetical protein V6N13_084540 [Hibiscus sabdariffa]
MVKEESYFFSWPPVGAPLNVQREEEQWRNFDNSVNAVSFGFVATAILISMFIVMAIFERFLRPNSSSSSSPGGDIESQLGFNGKLTRPSPKTLHAFSRPFKLCNIADFGRMKMPTSPAGDRSNQITRRISCDYIWFIFQLSGLSVCDCKMTVYTSGVSVLMPGYEIPTFIAHPAPVPCPPERPALPHINAIHRPTLPQ